MSVHVRLAGRDDRGVLLASIRAYYAQDHIPFDEATVARGLDRLATRPGWGAAWLVTDGEQILGHFLLTYGFDLEFGGRQATLTELHLWPEARGRGVGRTVMEQIDGILRAQGVGALELQVETQNTAARAFYDALGFRPYDRIPMARDVAAEVTAAEAGAGSGEALEAPVGVAQSYDRAAEGYAAALLHELDRKPLDRALLQNLIVEADGPILEVGGGPGQIARFLADHGADVRGSDLSPGMVALARRLHPHLDFEVMDFRHPNVAPGSFAAVVAFYAIVHTPPEDLPAVFTALHTVLRPGGLILLSFHVGAERLRADTLFGAPADLWFQFHLVDVVQSALLQSGFEIRATTVRAPYPGAEHPSTRAYVLARKLGG